MSNRAARQTALAAAYQQAVDARRGDRDGVVVTPVEVVDWQIRAVIEQLADQDASLTTPEVRILDPFGGTGIYLARLLQIAAEALTRPELIDLAGRCRMVEIDPEAVEIARVNLAAVMREETGQDAIRPVVICADTFDLGDEVWSLTESVTVPDLGRN